MSSDSFFSEHKNMGKKKLVVAFNEQDRRYEMEIIFYFLFLVPAVFNSFRFFRQGLSIGFSEAERWTADGGEAKNWETSAGRAESAASRSE